MTAPDRPKYLHAWLSFALVCGFFLFEFVARVEPSLASQGIMAQFQISEGQFGILISLFFWIYAPMQLVVGLLLDRFGSRRLAIPAVIICAMGPLLFASSSNVWLAGLGRFLTGLGGAFGFVSALYVANHRFSPRLFATLSGLVGAIGMIGTAVGLVWLAQLTQAVGWQPVFLGTGIAGLGLFALVILFLDDDRPQPDTTKASQPLAALPILFRDGRIWLIALVSALYYVPVNVYAGLWGKAELQADHGLTAVQAEFSVSMIFWGLALGGIASGYLSDRLGHRKWLLISGALISTVLFLVALFGPSGSTAALSGLLFFAGLFGGPQILTFAMAKEGHPSEIAGTALAFVNMIAIAGALVFQPAASYLLQATGENYQYAMIPVFGAPVLAAIFCLFVEEKRHPDHAVPRS